MVEQETVFDKEKFKNKRYLKGTPLYEYATKFAKRFAICMGCAHITLIVLGYFSNVSEEFLTAGPKQKNEKAIQLGMYEMQLDADANIQALKDELKFSPGHGYYESAAFYFGELKKRFLKNPETSAETKEEPKTTVSQVTKEASK